MTFNYGNIRACYIYTQPEFKKTDDLFKPAFSGDVSLKYIYSDIQIFSFLHVNVVLDDDELKIMCGT